MSAVTKALTDGVLSQGKYVEAFEAELARYLDVRRECVVAVSSGTAALHLALVVEREQLATAVYVPATTFISTGNVVKFVGLEPAFLDVDDETWNADGATLGVDLFGNPLTYEPLVEDAAEALGSEYGGRKCGTLGHIGCLSFFENKVITTAGEGGALVCKDLGDANTARLLRQQGKDRTTRLHQLMGYNYRMTEIQAAFGLAQMKRLEWIVERKRQIAQLYQESCPDLRFQREVGYSNRWLTCAVVPDGKKLDLTRELDEEHVPWRDLFAPLYYHPWFKRGGKPFPAADYLWRTGIALPSSPLRGVDYVRQVCEVINRVLKG